MDIELISTVPYSLSLCGKRKQNVPWNCLIGIKRNNVGSLPPAPLRDTPFKGRSVIHQGLVQAVEMHVSLPKTAAMFLSLREQ